MSKPWKRLAPWLPGAEAPDDGDAALRALADVTEVRRVLEQAELAAVRTARRHGRSWTDIATMLTVSRQSAWERWREIDDGTPAGEHDQAPSGRSARASAVVGTAVSELAGRGGRRRMVDVPDVVGLSSADALAILIGTGLEAVSASPDVDLRDSHDDLRPTVVVRQYPDPGTRIQAASTVRLWLERGDGEAGVREPRRPTTPPRAGRARLDERTEEAVG